MTKRQLMVRLNGFVREATRTTGIHPVTGGRRFTQVGWKSVISYLSTEVIPPHLHTLLDRAQGDWTVEAFLLRYKLLPSQLRPFMDQVQNRLRRSKVDLVSHADAVYEHRQLAIEGQARRSIGDDQVAQDLIDLLFPL